MVSLALVTIELNHTKNEKEKKQSKRNETDVLRLGISEIYHRRTSQTVLSLVGEGLPVLAVIRSLDEILIELCPS